MSEQAIALNRFGLGARGDAQADQGRVGSDPRGWLKAQLTRFVAAPPAIAALPGRGEIVASLGAYREIVALLRDERKAPGAAAAAMIEGATSAASTRADDTLRQSRREVRRHYVAGVGARLSTALASETPFAERMVHFWANHFAVSVDKLPVVALAADYEFTAIRPNLGKSFGDMAWAAIRHPAMLVYLDQAQSIGPGSPLAQIVAARGRRRLGLNENLAREVMELHTLGVRTGYAQADVTEFARVLTGWRVPMGLLIDAPPGAPTTRFDAAWHQPGRKTVVGQSYREGPDALDAVLHDLAQHPSTARFVCSKLARHFVADEPPPALVAKLVAAWQRSSGDLPTVYRALIEAPEAWAPQAAKLKTPEEFVISTARVLQLGEAAFARAPDGGVGPLGQRVQAAPSPAGWPDRAEEWLGPDAVWKRVEWASRVADRVGRRSDARAIAQASLGPLLHEDTARQIARAADGPQALTLLLLAPEFQRR